jgi:hypothetical protein
MLDNQGIWVQFPTRARDFSLILSIEIGFGAHPAYAMSAGGIFPRGKAARA